MHYFCNLKHGMSVTKSTIHDETNTKDEKIRYIKEAFTGFEQSLGNSHEGSYIYAQDVRAASHGYGSKTQECRYRRYAANHLTASKP